MGRSRKKELFKIKALMEEENGTVNSRRGRAQAKERGNKSVEKKPSH